MHVRLISGRWGGRRLAAPHHRRTHPMSERARAALFNSLGGRVAGADVLDAFAGTGALGLEALSRGGRSLVAIEKDRVTARLLRANVADLGANATVIATSVSNWLATAPAQQFDLIFADPPYHDPQFSTIARLVEALKPGGTMLLSHPGRGEVPIHNTSLFVVDNRSYGTVHLTFFRRVAPAK